MLFKYHVKRKKSIYNFYFKYLIKYIPFIVFSQIVHCTRTRTNDRHMLLEKFYLTIDNKVGLPNSFSFNKLGNVAIIYPRLYTYFGQSQHSLYYNKVLVQLQFHRETHADIVAAVTTATVDSLFTGIVYFSQFADIPSVLGSQTKAFLNYSNNILNVFILEIKLVLELLDVSSFLNHINHNQFLELESLFSYKSLQI